MSELIVGVLVGALIVVVGALVGRANGWGVGGYWVLGVGATLVAFAVFAYKDLRRNRRRPR